LDDAPPVLKVAEAAEVALVDPKTIRQAIHRGDLAALVTGRVIRIHRAPSSSGSARHERSPRS